MLLHRCCCWLVVAVVVVCIDQHGVAILSEHEARQFVPASTYFEKRPRRGELHNLIEAIFPHTHVAFFTYRHGLRVRKDNGSQFLSI